MQWLTLYTAFAIKLKVSLKEKLVCHKKLHVELRAIESNLAAALAFQNEIIL